VRNGGQSAVSKIVAPCLTNDDGSKMMKCTDTSRGVFVIKDKNGNINKDIKCRNLVSVIEPLATKKVDEIVNLDQEKKYKSRHLYNLKKDIIKRKEEIENLKDTLCGFKKNSFEWHQLNNRIIEEEQKIDDDYEQINIYEEEGVLASNEDDYYIDTKLMNGALNIKEMKVDSSKFSNSLAQII
jgi:hypothetical protein